MIPATLPRSRYRSTLIRPTYDTQGGTNWANVASGSYTHTVGAGLTNPMLIVFVGCSSGSLNGNYATTVTCAGTAMTLVPATQASSNSTLARICQMFYLPGVASGANTVAITMLNGTSTNVAVGSISIQHADQSGSPFDSGGAVTSANTTGNSVPLSIPSSASTDLIVAGACTRGGNPSAGSMTVRAAYAQSNCFEGLATASGTGSAFSTTWTWTTSDNYAMAGVAVHGATA